MLETCVNYLVSAYNTEVGSTAFTVGVNAFAAVIPDEPTEMLAVVSLPGFADRTQPVRGREFQVILRGKSRNVGDLRSKMTTLTSLLDKKTNILSGNCGRIKATQEDPDSGLDGKERYVLTQQFILTTI